MPEGRRWQPRMGAVLDTRVRELLGRQGVDTALHDLPAPLARLGEVDPRHPPARRGRITPPTVSPSPSATGSGSSTLRSPSRSTKQPRDSRKNPQRI